MTPLERALSDPTLYGPESRWTPPVIGPAPICPVCGYPWALADRVCVGCGAHRGRWTLADEREWIARQPCECRWCAECRVTEPVPDLLDGHRETD